MGKKAIPAILSRRKSPQPGQCHPSRGRDLASIQKILLLKDGPIIRSGDTEEVLSTPILKQLYGVSLQLLKKKGRYWPIPE